MKPPTHIYVIQDNATDPDDHIYAESVVAAFTSLEEAKAFADAHVPRTEHAGPGTVEIFCMCPLLVEGWNRSYRDNAWSEDEWCHYVEDHSDN